MLGAYLILWSLATGLMGFVTSLTGILILRHSCGLFQAGAYPVAAGVVRRWVPIQRRGIASSMIAVGGRLGGAIAPVLTIQMMLLWTHGSQWWTIDNAARASITSWRPVMMVYGAVGIVFGVILMRFFRDWPQEHPAVNSAELALIREGDVPLQTNKVATLAWPPIIPMARSLPLWMVSFVQFASNFGWAFLVTKLPQYLEEVFKTTQQNQGWVQSLPLAAGVIGLFLGGAFTDRLTQRFGIRFGRAIAMGLSRLMVAMSFLAMMMVDSAFGATLCLVVIGLSTDLGTPACWAFGQDVGGRHVGSVFGWSNMWGNLGAALSPIFFGYLVASASAGSSGWQSAFIVCAVINVAAAIASFGIDASKPLQA
jgi:MFS family permease